MKKETTVMAVALPWLIGALLGGLMLFAVHEFGNKFNTRYNGTSYYCEVIEDNYELEYSLASCIPEHTGLEIRMKWTPQSGTWVPAK